MLALDGYRNTSGSVSASGDGNDGGAFGVFDTEEEAEQFAKGVNPGYWILK